MKKHIFLITMLAIGFQSCTDDPSVTDDCTTQTLDVITHEGFTADLESTDGEYLTGTVTDDNGTEVITLPLPVFDLTLDLSKVTTTFEIVQFENRDVIKMSKDESPDVYLHDLNSTSDMASFLVSYDLDDKAFVMNLDVCNLPVAEFSDAIDYLQNQTIDKVDNRTAVESAIILAHQAGAFVQGAWYGFGRGRGWW